MPLLVLAGGPRPWLRAVALAGVAAPVLMLACMDLGPDTGGVRVMVQPRFALTAGAPVPALDQITIRFHRTSDQTVAVDTVVQWPAHMDTLEIGVVVRPRERLEEFTVELAASAAGVVLFRAEASLTIGGQTPPALHPDMRYIGPGAAAAAVGIADAVAEMLAADTVRLAAIVLDSAGQPLDQVGIPLFWVSLDTTAAMVSPDGLVTAARRVPAQARIGLHLAYTGLSDTLSIAVTSARIEVTPTAPVLDALGDTVRLAATGFGAFDSVIGELAGIEWQLLDSGVVTLTVVGATTARILAESVGSARVAAYLPGGPADTVVATVRLAGPEPASVTIMPTAAVINALGWTRQFTATVRDADGEPMAGLTASWASLDPAIATVDDTGLATGVATGVARVTAVFGELADTAELTIRQVAAEVHVFPGTATVALADTVRLSATATDSNGITIDGGAFVWTSASTAVASVDADGLVTAIGEGTTPVHATLDGATGSSLITVTSSPVPASGRLALGTDSSCMIDDSGQLFCWGSNFSGELGIGYWGQPELLPRRVAGGPWVEVSVGDMHACAVDDAGRGWCWGDNPSGQIGSAAAYSHEPVEVAGGLAWITLSAGSEHSCGIATDGRAFCWGGNGSGQLGDGTATNRSSPVEVSGDGRYLRIAAGNRHSCAITTGGETHCWGGNAAGQLGDGGTVASAVPVTVAAGGVVFQEISAGDFHTCAVASDGTGYCWGANTAGQLGTGDFAARHSPAAVAGGYGFVRIQAALSYRSTPGVSGTCGVTRAGEVLCWGENTDGRGGRSEPFLSEFIPTPNAIGSGFTDVAIGTHHACAIEGSGHAHCWGLRSMLGSGIGNIALEPVAVQDDPGLAAVTAGQSHSCGRTAAGGAYCWGSGYTGALGDGSVEVHRVQPTPVAGGLAFSTIHAGDSHSCGVSGNAGYCWGFNGSGRLGTGNTTSTVAPAAVVGDHAFGSVVAGGTHSCGIDLDGQAWCWGTGTSGQLGAGGTTSSSVPLAVTGGHSFQQLTLGNAFSCGIAAGGQAFCWGRNTAGQLGDGTTTQRNAPTPVSGSHAFIELASGSEHACGIVEGDTALCWGRGTHGRLGDGTTVGRTTPTPVDAGSLIGITAGAEHSCAIDPDGRAWCWGDNWDGQLGTGTRDDSTVPIPVASGEAFSQIAAGLRHTCALTVDGRTHCWGPRGFGQIGDGTMYFTAAPVPVGASPDRD